MQAKILAASRCLIFVVSFLALTLPASAEEKAETGTDFVFAVSWQSGFCRTQPAREECRDLSGKRFDATHFALHGLWPVRKSYCGVAADIKARDRKGGWLELPKLALTDETADRLSVAMPGTRSGLDRHQWLRSGTCHGGTAQQYFSLQLRMLDELNASAARTLFADRLGKAVTEPEIKQAFDATFGKGAGERVRMRCRKVGDRNLVTGLTIGLGGDIDARSGLSGLILAAAPTDFKCREGIVDAASIR